LLSDSTANLSGIDASQGALPKLRLNPAATDQGVVAGANSGTTPLATSISLAVAMGTASSVAIAGNTAMGVDDNNANTRRVYPAHYRTAPELPQQAKYQQSRAAS